MKRYRVIGFDFDTRAVILDTKIENAWEERIKEQWEANKRAVREGIVFEFGAKEYERKIEDFVALGANPMSLISFHNLFLRQCRSAFVYGSYYPALVSACTLGERILNRLVIHLREYFKGTPEYRKVFSKDSFANWNNAIEILEKWEVLLAQPAADLRRLGEIRHHSVHFNPETETDVRSSALEAISLLQSLVAKQFSAFGNQPWYIPSAKGASYVAKSHEETPFVKEFVLPSCVLVGPKHRLQHSHNGWLVHDDHEYGTQEVSDEEFVNLVSG